MAESPRLRRELRLVGAVTLGLGSILGTGVFVSIGLAAGIVGTWVVAAVVIAAVVATCNALSSAQLAAAYPTSGGTYEYGYELLHPLAGFSAGWMFLCAKSASAATAALGFAGYVLNAVGVESPTTKVWIAAGAVVALTALVAGGLRRSTIANTIIVGVTLLALVAFVVGGSSMAADNWSAVSTGAPATASLLEATALMFVAYTGYGRIATLGEEVVDPRRTIPRAIVVTVVVTALLYVAVAVVAVGAVGGDALLRATEEQSAPLEVVARTFGVQGLPELVALGAITAMLGVLLNLLLGLSRVVLAMGRRGDLPHVVTSIHSRRSTPQVAVVVVGVLILTITAIGSVRLAWSFSAFTVLVYYSLTNLAALKLAPQERRYSRAWAYTGLVGCLGLAFWVEPRVWLSGSALLFVGWVWYVVSQRHKRDIDARARHDR